MYVLRLIIGNWKVFCLNCNVKSIVKHEQNNIALSQACQDMQMTGFRWHVS